MKDIVSNKMRINLKIFGALVKSEIFENNEGKLIITMHIFKSFNKKNQAFRVGIVAASS